LYTFGRYELLCEIASGGMATVFAARVAGAVGFEKLVAIKRMLPAMSEDPRFRNMFLDEARVAAHINSPYVVSTFDLDAAPDGSLYIVMDLVVGCSLADILRSLDVPELPFAVVATIGEQAARGLHDAHEARTTLGEALRIVHRDVSPQNILVGIDAATRITDFGVAHAAERLTKTQGNNVKGKLAYCSPEQLRSEPLDRRSDIFSLGIVLWEALTKQRLFRRQDTSECLRAILSDPIPDPRTVRPDIPPALAAIVMRALAPAPDVTLATAGDL
jgi:serine/threonine protein kinase